MLTMCGDTNLQQVEGLRVDVREEGVEAARGAAGEGLPHDWGLLGPLGLGRGAEDAEDLAELIYLVLAGEERLAEVELGQDAAAAPDVHRGGVGGAEQDLGGAVPQRDHLQGEGLSNAIYTQRAALLTTVVSRELKS